MHGETFLQDLAIVMIVAGAVTVIFHRLKQPVVLGYILAGVLVGPHTPPFPLISHEQNIQTLSELGIIFLMFTLGLEFHLRKLRSVGATALIAATLEILLMIFAGYEIGRALGWSDLDSVFLGAILSISSTTIIIKALEELGKSRERFAELIFGILIVEDILAIVMIALLSGFGATGSLDPAEVVRTGGKLTAFLAVLLIVGLIAVPRLLNWISKYKSNEMLLVTVVGLCFGVSLLTVKLGYSVALGAFLIGAIVAEARQIARIEGLMQPLRDLFSAVFFVSIGLLIQPAVLLQYLWPILLITFTVIVGKVAACTFGAFVAGNDRNTSLRIGMGLAQIGEFSFIIASLGLSLGTSHFLYPIAIAVSALTTLATPYLIRSSDALVRGFDRVMPPGFTHTLEAYTAWMGTLSRPRERSTAAKFIRQCVWQIALNLMLVSAVFITARYFRDRALGWWPSVPGGMDGMKALLWLGAMLCSLPMLIAIVRKLQALGMIISELGVPREASGEATNVLRAIVSNVLLAAGLAALLLAILLLSSALLPSWNVLLIAVLLLIAATVAFRRSFIRLYALGQLALRETLAQAPHGQTGSEGAFAPMLRSADLSKITIAEGWFAAGKLIGELRLRSESGASVVGIQRGDGRVVNPGADEELHIGDEIMLLGNQSQIAAARLLLERGIQRVEAE
jgi:CPA2 family monovalent cation:H+ antiporter-2